MAREESRTESTRRTSEKPIIYLVDGSAYIYRAYHAIRGLTNSKGFPTNAVFGFTRMLINLFQDRSPEYAGMFFDAKGPNFRHELYKDYKANRPPMPEDLQVQIQPIRDVTDGFNLKSIEIPGYEADDLIGTVARTAQAEGFFVVMVTGDKDFMQLVTENAVIWDPMRDKTIDAKTIMAEYGIAPRQVIDVLGLSGDASDNIPGVPGIGWKTALKLVQTHGDIGGLYEQVDQVPGKKQRNNLIAFKDQALLSRKLVTIDTHAPIDMSPSDFAGRTPDRKRLMALFGDLEFRQLQSDFFEQAPPVQKRYRCIMNRPELDELVLRIKSAGRLAVDTETTSTSPMAAKLVGLSVAMVPGEAFYVPCGHDYLGAPQQLRRSEVLDALRPVLEDPSIEKIGQNIKYDWIVLARHGVRLAGVVFDTMLGSYLLNPSKRSHSLDQIALDFLNHKNISYAEVAGKGKKEAGFNTVPLEKAVSYAAEDADITLMACEVLQKALQGAGLSQLMETVEMPLVPVLVGMEMAGIHVDRGKLVELSKRFQQRLDALEEEIYRLAGETFNIRSSQQLGKILFEKLDLPVQKKTRKKTAYSTDMDVLVQLAEKHELPAKVLDHRTLSKLKSTYSDALLELIHAETGRIHTSFNQTVTATGRLSSSDPNLQNIPIRTQEGREIRRAFVPRTGWYLVSADYSQIELRILAHCSDDPILIQAFQKEEDIHTRTAMEVFQAMPGMVDPELRRQAKAINFGIIYGMSPFGLSKALGISQKMAKTYIDSYFARYSGVKRYIDHTVETARETRKTSTLLGRIRLLPEINNPNRTVRQFAERTAVNTPIQGTAADLIKVAMIRMDRALHDGGFQSEMLLSVHDEIIFEAPPDELDSLKQLALGTMESIWELSVPLKVNVAWGANWTEAH